MKNLLFFKIVTNRYLKMYSLLIIIGWTYAPHICNKYKKKEGNMVVFVTFIVHLCFNKMKQKK